MTRVLSLFTPSGRPTLGNLLGALLPSARLLETAADCVFGISDLHALTAEHDHARLRERSLELAGVAVAAGLDPARCVFFLQSHVPAHAELSYLLESTAHYGEMQRMVQFKEKSARQPAVRLSLLTYPALMAADILLYQATDVPVGADQAQHVELTRDLAARFNGRYGPVFTLPRAVHPPAAARVMDLTDPTAKMSKSLDSPGTVYLLDPVDVIRRKIMRAVTDSGSSVTYDPDAKPGRRQPARHPVRLHPDPDRGPGIRVVRGAQEGHCRRGDRPGRADPAQVRRAAPGGAGDGPAHRRGAGTCACGGHPRGGQGGDGAADGVRGVARPDAGVGVIDVRPRSHTRTGPPCRAVEEAVRRIACTKPSAAATAATASATVVTTFSVYQTGSYMSGSGPSAPTST